MFPWLPQAVKDLLGRGLTDHPTSNEMTAFVTRIGSVAIPKNVHAKLIFYSRGLKDPANSGQTRFPFNVEMNINHEYWHLRDNDPNDPNRTDPNAFSTEDPHGPSRVDIKFSVGNPLDDVNEVKAADPFQYVPEVRVRNLKWMDHLRDSRFPALAGWNKDVDGILAVLNDVTNRIFAQFSSNGVQARPDQGMKFGERRQRLRLGHGASRRRQPAHAVSLVTQRSVSPALRRRRRPACRRHESSLCVRHVGDAVQLGREPGPHACRAGAAAVAALRVSEDSVVPSDELASTCSTGRDVASAGIGRPFGIVFRHPIPESQQASTRWPFCLPASSARCRRAARAYVSRGS